MSHRATCNPNSQHSFPPAIQVALFSFDSLVASFLVPIPSFLVLDISFQVDDSSLIPNYLPSVVLEHYLPTGLSIQGFMNFCLLGGRNATHLQTGSDAAGVSRWPI